MISHLLTIKSPTSLTKAERSSPNKTTILHQGHELAALQMGDEFGNGRQKELAVQLILNTDTFKTDDNIGKVMSGSLPGSVIKLNRQVKNIESISISNGVAEIKFTETNDPDHVILFNRTAMLSS